MFWPNAHRYELSHGPADIAERLLPFVQRICFRPKTPAVCEEGACLAAIAELKQPEAAEPSGPSCGQGGTTI